VISARSTLKSTPGMVDSVSAEVAHGIEIVPFPLNSYRGNGNATRGPSSHALPTRGRAAQPAGALERPEHLAEALILDRQAVSELRAREHDISGQRVEHLLLETARGAVLVPRDDLQVRRLRIRRDGGQINGQARAD
jgi:hypothetical protein